MLNTTGVEKIVSREADLLRIYSEIYPVLMKADLSRLPERTVRELRGLEAPDVIDPAKVAAVLKAMLGSTSEDRFSLEDCYGVPMPGASSISAFVRERLEHLGIHYHDFWPYLRAKGWMKTEE